MLAENLNLSYYNCSIPHPVLPRQTLRQVLSSHQRAAGSSGEASIIKMIPKGFRQSGD